MSDPLVSVIIPVFNGEKYLRESIHSVLSADYIELEMWVVDDGSSDSSREILASFKDPRLKIVLNDRNMGVAAALNRLLGHCSGKYVARMDADDLCLKSRFRVQVDYLETHPEIGLLGAQVACFPGDPKFPIMPKRHELIDAWCLFASPMIHPTVMWRRELNLTYQETPPTAEDYDLWVKSLKRTRLENLADEVIQYRQDFGVKKVSYLKEQKSGGSSIRSKLLDELGIESSDPGRDIHEKLSQLRVHPGVYDSTAVSAWLKHLQVVNSRTRRYHPEALDVMLARKWYDFHVNEAMNGKPALKPFLVEKTFVRKTPPTKRIKLLARSLRNVFRKP